MYNTCVYLFCEINIDNGLVLNLVLIVNYKNDIQCFKILTFIYKTRIRKLTVI